MVVDEVSHVCYATHRHQRGRQHLLNSHIHRLLDTDFACRRLHETRAPFAARAKKVEKYMNSAKFKAKEGGRGLMGLAQDLRARCQQVVDKEGERIPK